MRHPATAIVLAAFLFVAVVDASEENADRAEAFYGACKKEYKARKPDRAIKACTKAIEAKSAYPEPYVLRGYIRKTHHDPDGAISDFSRALDLTGAGWCDCDSKKWEVLRNRAELREAKGDVDGSIADYSAAIRVLEAGGGTEYFLYTLYMSRADAKKKKGDVDGAIADVTAGIGHGSGISGYRRRADLKREKGDVDGAIADRSSAIRLRSAAEDYRARSDLKKGKGDLDGAITDLTDALLTEPCSAETFHSRSLAQQAKGNAAGAQSDEAEAKRLGISGIEKFGCELELSGNAQVLVPGRGPYVNVPEVGMRLRDEPIAKSFLAKKEAGLIKAAQTKAAEGDHAGAVYDATHAVKLDLDNPIPYAIRGAERMKLLDFDGAIADLTEAIRISEKQRLTITAGMYLNRGLAESTVADHQAAVRDLGKAIEIAPRDVALRRAAYTARGKARWALPHEKRDDLDGIIDDFTKAIELETDMPDAYNGRSFARRAKGDARGADEDLSAANRLKEHRQGVAATLLVTTNADCDWKLDGAPQGRLKAEDAKVVPASLGKHLILAESVDGQDRSISIVNIEKGGQEMVEIKLKAARQQRAQAAEDQKPTWTDPETGLMWNKRDNGSHVTWQQAHDYCSSLSVSRYAGYSGWRLPAIEELAGIYDPFHSLNGRHVKGRLTLTGWQWSATAGGPSGQVSMFLFTNGRQAAVRPDTVDGRAICVRRSGE